MTQNAMLDSSPIMHAAPQDAHPWYRQPGYRPTNFMLDAAAKFIGQPLSNAYTGIMQAAGFQQDPSAPEGYVTHDALNRGAQGIAAGQLGGSMFSRAPANSLRSGAAGRSGMDMSDSARLQRARDMGFDTDTPWRHFSSSASEIGAFDPSRIGSNRSGSVPSGFHFLNDKGGDRLGKHYGSDSVEAYLPKNLKEIDSGATSAARFFDENYSQLEQAARESGSSGLVVKDRSGTQQAVIFDPSNIRRTTAAFDPARRDSSDLLAAHPLAGAVPTYQREQPRNAMYWEIY